MRYGNRQIFSISRFVFLLISIIHILPDALQGQCCSGGSGSPIAGGASQGTLLKNQAELNFNYQNFNTSLFLKGDSQTENFLEHYYSQYLYSRAGFGITDKLTFSLEAGYFLNRTQYGLDYNDTVTSGGIADMLIFPRYNVLRRCGEKSESEITLGMGMKIPLGSHNDSLKYFTHPVTGENYYMRKPLSVQATTGANDFIFYGFFLHSYPSRDLRLFSVLLFIRKGWNPLGEKAGDFASAGFFASKTFFNKLAVTLQLRGEWNGKMQRAPGLPFPNYDPKATGSKKIFLTPQLNYTFRRSLTFFLMSDFPLYQFLNDAQIASQFQTTAGITWRFMLKK